MPYLKEWVLHQFNCNNCGVDFKSRYLYPFYNIIYLIQKKTVAYIVY